ncbi:MAG: amino acid adenylation domain-containing protein [Nitrospira sp. CR1.2]|nr:amino acid adenylation domain-containing protein [Nitrospira sp. CR1.2]
MQANRTEQRTTERAAGGALKNIEAVYPLSPMQEGMLFHTLMNPGTGIYLMQNRYYVEGEMDAVLFRRAWEQVIARHSILRTSFVWKNQKRPLQAVHKEIEVPLDVMDWRGKERAAQIAELDALLQQELAQGVDFAKAPLMRLRLIRLTDRTYQFVHSFHHILLDEWCISPLLMDFLAHYEACAQGLVCQAEKPRSYRDYIAWLQKQDLDAANRFWREYLQGFSTPTPLAYDRPPEGLADQNDDAADHCVYLSADLTARLTALAQQHRVTANTFVQGAWALLLAQYSGEKDVLFGVTVAGRPTQLVGVESVLGLFINTLPLRVSVAPDRPVMAWLKDLLAENVRLREYEYTPLIHIQRSSEIPRGEALFHSLFVFENAPVDPALCEGRIMFRAEEEQYRVHTNYPMTVMGWPGKELGLKLSYGRRLFDSETVLRMIGHLQGLLEALITRPDVRIGDLPMLDREERTRLLSYGIGESDKPQDDRSVALRFEAQVRRSPQAIAVRCGDQSLTYDVLNRRANRLAHRLRAEGIGPDAVVAVLDERSPDLLTMILGCFKAGAAYLPLDPHHPVARVARLLELSRVRVVVVSRRLSGHLEQALSMLPQATRPLVVVLDDLLSQQGEDHDRLVPSRQDQLAYVIYTSGSTGIPKGAMVTMGGMLNNIESKVRSLAIGPKDVIAQTASQCFDISVWQFLTALLCGATTHILSDELVREPSRLLTHLDTSGITIYEAVPAVLQALLDVGDSEDAPPVLAPLRWVLPTGEALPPALCRRWFERHPKIPLMNAYGPAECADDVAVHPILAAPAEDSVRVPIGRPIQRLRLYIVNRLYEPVPVGVSGELWIGGIGVGRGYLEDCARTAEAFVPDPFRNEPGARLYRTGDLARYRPDGTIEYVGRLDHQVKVRGFRIELGEIESCLTDQIEVREAAVIVREDRPGDRRLAAYVVPQAGRSIDSDRLRTALQAQLPEYMVPSIVLTLDTLPRTPNGKVDRRALPAPDLSGLDEATYVAPRTVTEELLAAIWADILGLERVGVRDQFFELGGHSLLATQVVSRIRSAFHIELPLRAAFECPTVADLARTVDRVRAEGQGRQVPPLTASRREGPAPLSFAQQRLWFLSQLEPESWLYNLSFGLRLRGPLDVDALRASFEVVATQHDQLRTWFLRVEGRPVQVNLDSPAVPFDRQVAAPAPGLSLEQYVAELAGEEARRPFVLEGGLLWRIKLVQLRDQDHLLLVTLHHAIADGWSLNVLLADMLAAYGALREGQPVPLTPPAVRYADYARWQREWLKGDVLERELDYWKQTLAGASAMIGLHADHPRPTVQTFRGARRNFTVSPDVAAALQGLSRRQGVTLFMTLLAAFQVLLHRYSRDRDLSIGTPIANRTTVETEGVIGFFVNTLVLRTDVSGHPRFVDLLERVRETVLGAQSHQDVPFEQVVDALKPDRDLSHAPLFQVMFALQTLGRDMVEIPNLTVEPVEVDPGSAKFDLSLEMTWAPEGLTGFFEFNLDLFEPATIDRMTGHFLTLLAGIVAEPQRKLAALPLMDEAERAQVVGAWNQTARAYARTAVPAQIAAEAARTPAAIAVRAGATTVTYAALLRQAYQLAQALRRHGVGPERLVAVALDRSVDLVVALLGTWYAGAAFVPLDPSYPVDRLRYMLDDSQAALLVTDRAQAARLAHPGPTLCLEQDRAPLDGYPPTPPAVATVEAQLAYVLYTSGSTGQPKGAGNSHAGLRNRLQWMQAAYGLTDTDRVLQKTPISFDVSVWEFFWPLMVGAELVMAEPGAHKDPARLIEHITRAGITTLHFVPPMLQAFLDQPGVERCRSLRQILCSGEALPATLPPRVQQLLPGVALHNLYGPTEAAIDVTAWTCPTPPAATVPLGRPIANLQIYILDPQGEPVPIGVPGECYIGGIGVGRGYHRRPDLTAARFVPDPFSAQPGQRLYRTGDLVRYRPDGTIEYLGRLDHQVKIRGVRIELGEVEAAVRQQPGVREAVVLARRDGPGGARLVGYVTMDPDRPIDPAALKAALAERLPEYLVPAVIVRLAQLPLSPNGKVDRGALPAPEVAAPRTTAYEAPKTQPEQQLAAIWAQVLGLAQVGRHDNFFELGGDSILGLQVIAQAKEVGLSLTPRQLFQQQTIEALATVVNRESAAAPTIQAEQGFVSGTLPMTPAQQWWFEQRLSEPHHWNQSLMLTISESPDRARLASALGLLLERHDALRMRLDVSNGPTARIEALVPSEELLTCVDLRELSEDAITNVIAGEAERCQQSLHLEQGPLFRALLFDLGPRRPSRLLLIAHHLVVDGVSWRILLEDLERAYLAGEEQQADFPPKTTSIKQWTEAAQTLAKSGALSSAAAFWSAQDQPGALSLPLDDPTGARTEASAETCHLSFSREETEALLRQAPAAYKTQVNDLLLAALVQTFHQWTGEDRLLLDLEGHGRESVVPGTDLSRTVGWFTSMFPLLLRRPDGSTADIVKGIKEQLRAIPSGGVGYGLLRYLAHTPESERLRHQTAPQVCFNYLGQLDRGGPEQTLFGLASEPTGREHGASNRMRYELTINADVTDGRLTVMWSYSGARFRRATVEMLAASYRRCLCELIAHCCAADAGGYTPSDFPDVQIDQDALDNILETMERSHAR